MQISVPRYPVCVSRLVKTLSFTSTALLVAACSVNGGDPGNSVTANPAMVTGSVTYRERIALTPDAVVDVQLLDVSLADATAKQISRQTIKPGHQVPISFELAYDPADIDEPMLYAVRATIREGERMLFTTDRQYLVLTRGYSNHVDLVLVRVRGEY